MRLLQVVGSFVGCVSALGVRDSPLNATITTSLDLPPAESISVEPEPEMPTSRQHRPHMEVSESGFEGVPATKDDSIAQPTRPSQPDIGSVIQSILTTALKPSGHIEKSEDGWTIATPTREAAPRIEVSTDGFGQPTAHDISIPQVTAPGPGVTPGPYVHIPVVTPPPAITQGDLTLQPVPVTRVRVTTIDGKPTTLEAAISYQYAAGSSTLTPGAPQTINNVVVAMSTNADGSTILTIGDTTTTLPPPIRGPQAVQLSTTIIDGTTKYILAGQTLAPNQAITVGNVPISIGTVDGGATVLVMGDMSTTFSAPGPGMTDFSASAPARPGSQTGNVRDGGDAATTSKSGGAMREMGWGMAALAACVQALV